MKIFSKSKPGRVKRFKGKAVFKHGHGKAAVKIDLEAAETMRRLREMQAVINEKETALKADPENEDLQEQSGSTVLDMFAAVLGRDGVLQALSVYKADNGKTDTGDFVRDVKHYIFFKAVPQLKKLEAKELKWGWMNG